MVCELYLNKTKKKKKKDPSKVWRKVARRKAAALPSSRRSKVHKSVTFMA